MAQRLLSGLRARAITCSTLNRIEDSFARSVRHHSFIGANVHRPSAIRHVAGRPRYFQSEAVADDPTDEAEDAGEHEEVVDESKAEDLQNDAPRAREDLHSEASQKLNPIEVPAAWRDPGLWVDLELERAGLSEGAESDKLRLESPWGSQDFPHPDSSVLHPHRALNDHRSRPFVVPRGQKLPDAVAGELLESNHQRLTTLWRISSSHGISWDELDHAYVTFAKAGKKQYDEWARSQDESNLPLAAKEKKRCLDRARRRVAKFITWEDPNDATKDAETRAAEYYPSRIKRVAARYYRNEKRRRLDPWKPGRLTSHLQQLVVARMLRRETAERALKFRSPST